jgi:sulfate transport system substrate-binding protein
MRKWQNTTKSVTLLVGQIQSYVVQAISIIKHRCQRAIESLWKKHSLYNLLCLFLVGVGLSMVLAACSFSNADTSANSQRDVKLKLVSYSVTKAAYDRIIPKFVEKWKQEHNQNITFEESYGASGVQAGAVIDGSQEADVVHLSLALDTYRIQQAGLIQPKWEKEAPKGGIVSRSVVVLVTRAGNPKGIKTWTDLTKDGLNIVTPNPKTSGSAIWNFLSLWGSISQKGGEEAQAIDFTTKVYKNAPVLPESARAATELFFQKGQGDVLITYENEVILAEQNGPKLPYSVPDTNISIDNPVTVVDKNVAKHGTRKIAEAFVDFLYTPEAQREFANFGFRPVQPFIAAEVASKYPQLQTLFTVEDLGGWDAIQKKFFVNGGIFDKIQSASKA